MVSGEHSASRSYIVESPDGGIHRRNRCDLFKTNENVPLYNCENDLPIHSKPILPNKSGLDVDTPPPKLANTENNNFESEMSNKKLPKIMRELADQIAPTLTIIFQTSLDSADVPKD